MEIVILTVFYNEKLSQIRFILVLWPSWTDSVSALPQSIASLCVRTFKLLNKSCCPGPFNIFDNTQSVFNKKLYPTITPIVHSHGHFWVLHFSLLSKCSKSSLLTMGNITIFSKHWCMSYLLIKWKLVLIIFSKCLVEF